MNRLRRFVARPGSPAVAADAEEEERFKAAFADYNSEVRIGTTKVAFILVVFLLPIGIALDLFVYPQHTLFFLVLRMICSAVAFACFKAMYTDFGRNHFRAMCMGSFLLPSVCIDLMIHFSEGVNSPYYAGLNLLLVGIVWVAQIEFNECLLASGLTLLLYGLACYPGHGATIAAWFNSYYFLSLNCLIVSIGCYWLGNLRYSEFKFRSQLDSNRRELQESNSKLVELDKAKSTFFANVSHELRTPLTLLIGPLDRLRRRDGAPQDRERQALLDIMYNNAMRLLRLINDLLDLVRLDSGVIRVRRERVELIPFLEGIASSVTPMAAQRKLDFATCFDAAPYTTIFIDRDKVEKIVLNLLFNSFKFTPEPGRVEFKASVQEGMLQIVVRDTGKGIDPSDLPRVFDRFWQAEAASTRRYQGVGIGLALVKELTEAHGGSVAVKSEVDKGTEMRIVIDGRDTGEPVAVEAALPASKEPASSEWLVQLYRRAELFPAHVMSAGEEHDGAPDTSDTRPAVLIADDEPEMRRFLHSQLKDLYAVVEARNGSEALELARSRDFVLILLDLMMPGIDGITLTKALREEPRTESTPIVMLTARADDDSKMRALEAGVTDFLTKPFASSELALRSRNLIFQQQLREGLAAKTRELERALEQIKETEAQMVHQAKMASLGQMSAGLLHEVNNPLNIANTAVHILKKRLGKLSFENPDAIETPLSDLIGNIRRAADIVGNLRSFSHPDTSNFGRLDLREIVQSAVTLTQARGSGIDLEISIPEKLAVWGNRNHSCIFSSIFCRTRPTA